LPGKAIPEMTYTVSGGTLNSTHSFIAHASAVTAGQAFDWAHHTSLVVRCCCSYHFYHSPSLLLLYSVYDLLLWVPGSPKVLSSAFHLSGVGTSSTSLSGSVWGRLTGHVYCIRWQVTLC